MWGCESVGGGRTSPGEEKQKKKKKKKKKKKSLKIKMCSLSLYLKVTLGHINGCLDS